MTTGRQTTRVVCWGARIRTWEWAPPALPLGYAPSGAADHSGFASRASDRLPAPGHPFRPRRATGLGRRAVDDLRVGRIGCYQGVEHALPKPASRPSVEPIVDRRRRPVERRAVLPPAGHFQHMNNAADHPSVVDPTRSRLIARRQRFDRRPLPSAIKFNALIEF